MSLWHDSCRQKSAYWPAKIWGSSLLGVLLLSASSFLATPAHGAGIVFSELMYHPVDATSGILSGDEYEYVELFNASASTQSLSGANFTAGITYVFPTGTTMAAGQYLVIVKNRAAFTNRYPSITNIAPNFYTGSLANSGEAVTLRTSGGVIIFSATYLTVAPWPTAPDGRGTALRLIDPDGDANSDANWCIESTYNGTPGATGTCAVADIVINEVLTHADPPLEDAIELHNLTTNAVNITGWYLSDVAEQRKKYRITNTTVAANSYKVFYEYQFNGVSPDPNDVPFALNSAQGDDVYLTAADGASNLTRFVDYVEFGAAENGVSFGRYPNGTGDVVTLAALSFGTSVTATNPPGDIHIFRSGSGTNNGLPKVGPIIISEVMYHPFSDLAADEYIELLNTSTGSVPLYHVAYPSNTWKLTTAVEYTFPTGVTLTAGQRILITSTTNFTAFRATYGLTTNIPVYGPWTGSLNNAGESIQLYKPDTPEIDLSVPYILVDRLDYADDPPWPTAADGGGPSLERVTDLSYGNTVGNWIAGAPGGSPGEAPSGGFVNPQVVPAAPAAGTIFTVTVSVVAQSLPTQVVLQTSISGVTSNRIMVDNGTGSDLVAGDQVYSAAIEGQPDGTWLNYNFLATGSTNGSFALPATGLAFAMSPTLSIGMCNYGVFTTVQPTDQWVTYSATGTVSDPSCFYLYLNAAGEAAVDDIYVRDAGGTNHLTNPNMTTSLSGWIISGGNHSNTVWTQPVDDPTNGVMLVKAGGAGNTSGCFSCSVRAFYSPVMVSGTPAVLSFRARQTARIATNWFHLLVGAAPTEPVINEIMYHPSETNEPAYEYVEIYNPGTSSFDLSGWMLDGFGSFAFPTGTVIGAGGYRVAAGDPAAITAKYGITNVSGGLAGTLSNNGEPLALVDSFGRTIDALEYADDPPWPVVADGAGPSLERINAAQSATNSYNWATSRAETNWFKTSWTGTISAANNGAILFADFDGMAWIDDVSVTPASDTNAQLVSNGGFESGTNGWNFLGSHARSKVRSGMGRSGSAALALFSNERRLVVPDVVYGVELRYGDGVTNIVRSTTLPTTNGASYIFSWWTRREGLGGRIMGVVGSATNTATLLSHGTPGAVNASANTNAPFQIVAVTPEATVMPVGTGAVVRATLSTTSGISSVTLYTRVVATNSYFFTDRTYSSSLMQDNGVAPDLVAGDGEYAGSLPAQTSQWRLVRYHVLAQHSNGLASRWPAFDDPENDLGCWIQNAVVQTNVPEWHVLTDGQPVLYPIGSRACAVSPEGGVFCDVDIRHRGRPGGSTSTAVRTGLALRFHDGHALASWFGEDQSGVNFRARLNDHDVAYTRVVSEFLGYQIQRQFGFATPQVRHVAVWFDGVATITTELEDPEGPFLDLNGIDTTDYVSRSGYTGRRTIGGDESIDNFDSMKATLLAATNTAKTLAVQTNLFYESVQHVVAFESAIGNGDQYLDWNMFQHRRASDGRWEQIPWDLDICFDIFVDGVVQQTTNLHPYYQTTLYPSIFDGATVNPLGSVLFHPQSGTGSGETLPYRYRQQATLWRYAHTWFRTNELNARLDALQSMLQPAYIALNGNAALLTNKVRDVKLFIQSRRNFLMNTSWSDKMTNIWSATYAPTNIVINEVMVSPVSGGEYVELYNAGPHPVDLSAWFLQVAGESYRMPFGTMINATSYLVVADTQSSLTNVYNELGDASAMVRRFGGSDLWDQAIVFTSATEYATRVMEEDAMTLPNTGAVIRLLDVMSNVIDSVTYGTTAPWPTSTLASIELIVPSGNNDTPTNWRSSTIVGTPGYRNSATADKDQDGMGDDFEQLIINASGGAFTSITQVVGSADFDGDGVNNASEFVIGSDGSVADSAHAQLSIALTNAGVRVSFGSLNVTGAAYEIYSGRFYTLDASTNLAPPADWSAVTNFMGIPATGSPLVYTNVSPPAMRHYRFNAELRLRR